MHIIVDIRSSFPNDPIITQYAKNWVDLWISLHPNDTISYLHFENQYCPDNAPSIGIKSSWYIKNKRIHGPKNHEIFRCINFSQYPQYDSNITTIHHIFDHIHTLYSRPNQGNWLQSFFQKITKNTIKRKGCIVVPTLSTGQETVDLMHVNEEHIEVLPYLSFNPPTINPNIRNQNGISGDYWLYDGSYGSEANIYGLLKGFKDYRESGGSHILVMIQQPDGIELRHISDLIQKMHLTGYIKIIGSIDIDTINSLYAFANGWIYIGAYYSGGPRIELAKNHNIPLLISDIPVFKEYKDHATVIHPNHLSSLGDLIKNLENHSQYPPYNKKIQNVDIMNIYQKLLSEKR